MDWTGKRVFLTGASGFIGSHLAERLIEKGANLLALVRYKSDGNIGNLAYLPPPKRPRLVFGDIQDAKLVAGCVKESEIIFHLAALTSVPFSYVSPESFVRTNVLGTLNILEAVNLHGIERLIHTSTSECYGSAQFSPMTEAHPLVSQSPYAASKSGADKLVESFFCSYELPVTTLRPFNTFGPRQSRRAVIPNIICQALDDGEIRLGDLSPVRDFVFVEDTVNAFIAIAENVETLGKAIHVGSGEGIWIGGLADKIMSLTGKRKKILCLSSLIRPEHSEVSQLVCDATESLKLLNWRPRVTLDEGLRKTITFYEENNAFRTGFNTHHC